jgi:hypothetical protein
MNNSEPANGEISYDCVAAALVLSVALDVDDSKISLIVKKFSAQIFGTILLFLATSSARHSAICSDLILGFFKALADPTIVPTTALAAFKSNSTPFEKIQLISEIFLKLKNPTVGDELIEFFLPFIARLSSDNSTLVFDNQRIAGMVVVREVMTSSTNIFASNLTDKIREIFEKILKEKRNVLMIINGLHGYLALWEKSAPTFTHSDLSTVIEILKLAQNVDFID